MKKRIKLVLLFCIFPCVWCGQINGQLPELKSIQVDEKANGFVIQLYFDHQVKLKNFIAWQSKSDWFYITLYQVIGDSSKLSSVRPTDGIREFQVIESEESVQLGIKLFQPIEQFEFDYSDNVNEVIITLHFSRNQLASLETVQKMNLGKQSFRLSSQLVNWLYFTSAGLTTTGIMQQNKNTSQAGISMMISTLILDKIWRAS